MKELIAFFLLAVTLLACSSSKQVTGQEVPMKQLRNYVLVPGYQPTAPKDYFYITTEEEFLRLFTLTKMSPGSTTNTPDFTKEAVVAVILASTEKVTTLDIISAAAAGKTLTINYTVTDTATWTTFPHTPFYVAVINKNSKMKQVNFMTNGAVTKSLKVK